MRTMTITTGLLAALLLLPASASAITGQHGDYQIPTTVCGPPIDPTCWTMEPDTYTFDLRIYDHGQNSAGKSIETISARFKRWAFPEAVIQLSMKQSIIPMREATWSQTLVGGVVVSNNASVSADRSFVGIEAYCNIFRDSEYAGRGGIDSTPDEIMSACEFTRRTSDPQPDATAPPTPPAVPSITVPASAARCGAVKGSAGKVVVRSSRHSCGVARTVVARYARSLRSPAGWRCTAIVKDTGLRARCIRKSTGRANVRSAVYGIWVRR